MSKEEIKRQLKLSKRQSKDERYDYLCSKFNAIDYCIKLEKYTNKLQQENQKYKEVIDKAIKFIDNYMYENYCYVGSEDRLKDILKEVE